MTKSELENLVAHQSHTIDALLQRLDALTDAASATNRDVLTYRNTLTFYAAGVNWLSTPGPDSELTDDCGDPLPSYEMSAALKDHGDRARAALGLK
jgi:hypothetical protein